jgi:outer membrane protein assembly factor BamB
MIDVRSSRRVWRWGMKSGLKTTAAVAALGLILALGCSTAGPEPTPRPTSAPRPTIAPITFPTATPIPSQVLKWRFKTGGPVDSSPAVVAGIAYFGSWDGHLYAVHVDTGELLWRFATGGPVRSSPAVTEGAVYFGSDDRHLYAVDADTGRETWRFETQDKVGSSPAVADGTVYVGSEDRRLYAVDSITGQQRWSFETSVPAEQDPDELFALSGESLLAPRGVRSSPVVFRGAVYFASDDGRLYSVDRSDGEIVWEFTTDQRLYMSPAVAGDSVYIVDYGQGFLVGIDVETGEVTFEFQNSAPGVTHSSPVVHDDTAYLVTWNSALHAVDLDSAEKLWIFSGEGFALESSEAFVDSLPASPAVFGGAVYFSNEDGSLYAVDALTGDALWRFRTQDKLRSSPVVADGVVYFGSHDGYLYAVNASAP